MKKAAFLFCCAAILSSCFANNSTKDISGNWQLYKNQFLVSGDVGEAAASSMAISLSRVDRILGDQLGNYGSLKRSVELDPKEPYSLHLPEIYSASTVWIDGKRYQQYGRLGKSVDSIQVYYRENVIEFTPASRTTDIVIEFSNFHYPQRSAIRWAYLGDTTRIHGRYIRALSIDYLVLGSLVICFVLFFLLFLVNRHNKYNLYMSLFTLAGAVYLFTRNNTLFSELLSGLELSFMYQVNNLSSIWIFACILLFFSYLYPIEFNNNRTRFALFTTICISFLILVPVPVFNSLRLLFLFKAQIVTSGIIIIASLISAFRNSRRLSLLLLASFSVYWIAMLAEAFWGISSSLFLLLLGTSMFVLVAIKRAETSKVIEEKQERNRRIREVFTRFVPVNILDSLGNAALKDKPPGEYSTRDCTMMLLDIRDFTKLSEKLSAEDNFVMINEFYDIVGYEVDRHNGFIESYGGDGVKAIFTESANDAVASALAISTKVAASSGIKIGMAIHYGQVIFGTIGSDDRIQASAVSEVSRILSAMDHFESKMGVEIMLTGTVLARLTFDCRILFLGNIILKNQQNPVDLYQVIPPSLRMKTDFESGFKDGVRHIQKEDYPRALSSFEKAQQARKSHVLTAYYITQLKLHIAADADQFVLKL